MNANELAETLVVRLQKIGVTIGQDYAKEILAFISKRISEQQMLALYRQLMPALDVALNPSTSKERFENVKMTALKAWEEIVLLYNTSQCHEVSANTGDEPTEPGHPSDQTEDPVESKKKFPWLWVMTIIFGMTLSFTLGSTVFPVTQSVSSRATVQLEKKLADQVNAALILERNAWDVACTAKQTEVAERTATACVEAYRKGVAGLKKTNPPTTP
jgi:hypothetical protein